MLVCKKRTSVSVIYHSLSDKARPAGTFSRCRCRPRQLFCLWGMLWHCWACHCHWAPPQVCVSASRGWPGRSPRALSPPTPGWSPTRAGAYMKKWKYSVLKKMYCTTFHFSPLEQYVVPVSHHSGASWIHQHFHNRYFNLIAIRVSLFDIVV